MNISDDRPTKAALQKGIAGSFLSAMVGWLAMIFLLLFAQLFPSLRLFVWERAFFVVEVPVSGVIILATWLFVFMPMYLIIPAKSVFWKWPICSLSGAVIGFAILYGIFRPEGSEWLAYGSKVALGVVAGGSTCLFAALTRDMFRAQCTSTRSC